MKPQLLALLKKYSYKTGEFTLSSGVKSNYFIDCKKTLLLAEGNFLASRIILEEIFNLSQVKNIPKIDAVAGVSLGGCPLATGVSQMSLAYPLWRKMIMNSLYIRQVVKDHGTKNLIEGYVEPKSNIILLEDTITTGNSSIKALEILKNEGHNPVAVIAIIDRLENGGVAIAERFKIPVISIFNIKDII